MLLRGDPTCAPQAYGNHHERIRGMPQLQQLAGAVPSINGSVGIVAMRWALQSGAAVLPRSRRPEYIAANLQVFEEDLAHVMTTDLVDALGGVDANESLYGAHHLFVQDLVR